MRSIMVEEVVKVERYRAIDGTIFTDKKTCGDYDKELHEKNTEYIKSHGRMCKVLPELSYATDDATFYVITVDNAETASVLKQVHEFRDYLTDEIEKRINNAFDTKSDVLVSMFEDYIGGSVMSFYIYGTQAEITARTLENYNEVFATVKED